MKTSNLRLFFVLVALLSTSIVRAGNETIADRLKNPIYVVLDDNTPGYNEEIKYAVENFWTVSKFTFVTKDEYKELKGTEDNVFLMLLKDEGIDGGVTPFAQSIQLFYMVHNGTYRNAITGVPITDVIAGKSNTELVNPLRTLQDKLNFKIAKESENGAYADFNDQVKTRTGIIKTKKLYVTKSDLDKDFASVDDIKKVYQGEVFVVSDEEMNKLIETKQNDAVYVAVNNFKSGTKYTNLKQVIDAESGLVLYSDESKSGKASGFGKGDLENIQK